MTTRRDIGALVGALGLSNLVTNLWLPPSLYVPWNLAVATGAVAFARARGLDAADLGLESSRLVGGLRAGAVGAGAVAVGYGIALVTPDRSGLLRDERATALPPEEARRHVLGRIPLGTALTEEVIFRGVLPALLSRRARAAWLPGAGSSLLFGLWHVLPSLEAAHANAAVARLVAGSTRRTVALAVGSMTAAGLLLHGLRARTGHLAAPVLVHAAVNVFGLVAARWSARRSGAAVARHRCR